MKRGYLFLALGSEMYYLYAANCAASLKRVDPSINTALIHDENIENVEWIKKFFDALVPCPPRYTHDTTTGKADYMKPKLYLYDLTPFKKTVYLDADTICILEPGERERLPLIDKIPVFTAQCYEHANMKTKATNTGYTYWGDQKAIKHYYKLFDDDHRLPQLSTTIMAWQQTEIALDIFKTAQRIYDDKERPVGKFGDLVPDEFFFNVSCAINKVYPEIATYVYWHFLHGRMGTTWEDRDTRIRKSFAFATLGGAHSPDYSKDIYNKQAIKVGKDMGISPTIFAMDKKDYSDNRMVVNKHPNDFVIQRNNDFLRHPHVINLAHRKDRMKHFKKVQKALGIKKVTRFEAIVPEAGGYPSTMTRGSYGCMLSHQAIIRMAKENNWDRVTIFEDDVTTFLTKEKKEELSLSAYMIEDYTGRIPIDWDMVYFGGNHMMQNPTRHRDVYRGWSILTSHMIVYRNTVYDAILEMGTDAPFDVTLAGLHKQFKVYCPDPNAPLAWQMDGYSDINEGNVEYSILKPRGV